MKVDKHIVNGEEIETTRPLIADCDLWNVLGISEEGSFFPLNDNQIGDVFSLVKGEGYIMHGAHLNWDPDTDEGKKINEAVISKQKEEPIIVVLPGRKKPISMKLADCDTMFSEIKKSPFFYLPFKASTTTRESRLSSLQITSNYKKALNLNKARNEDGVKRSKSDDGGYSKSNVSQVPLRRSKSS